MALAAHYPLATPINPSFIDGLPTNPFQLALETGPQRGISGDGNGDGTFRPNSAIRRDEMALIFYKGVNTA